MTEAKKLTKLVIKFFTARSGFDGWWDSLPKHIQKEVEEALEETLGNTIPENPGPRKP